MTRVGSEVIRPILRSLDDMPVHVRQLAEMFRRHGNAHKRDVDDITDVDRALDNLGTGWRQDSGWTPDAVVSWKGDAPEPSDYLDADYISNHLARFENGASRLYFSDSLSKYGPGQADHSTFVFPTEDLQRVLNDTGGDAHEVARVLGIEPKYFHVDHDLSKPLVDVEVRHFDPSELENLRLPSGNEAGANEHWIPGGYLPSGIPEAVIDVPESATGMGGNYLGTANYGLWPGHGQSVTLHP